MRPIDKSKIYLSRDGTSDNCFAACLGSIMELPIEAIPRFEEYMREAIVWSMAHNWLGYYRLTLVKLSCAPRGYSLAIRLTNSLTGAPAHHCCIVNNGEVVYDPHGSSSNLADVGFYLELVSC